MARISEYERLQIQSLSLREDRPIDTGCGLFLMAAGEQFQRILAGAVEPAMRENGLNLLGTELAFDSDSSLADVYRQIQTAEVIVADVTQWSADLSYVLGACHGLDRCPLLIGAAPIAVPFSLMALRCVEYTAVDSTFRDLREHLTRAIRVFLAAARASEGKRQSDR